MKIKIGKRAIGKGEPCFIIAEVGINHNGSLETTKRMIDAATQAGCDAVKFQAYKTAHLYSKNAGKLDWKDKEKSYSYDIYEANKGFELPFEWLSVLRDYSAKKGILFFSSVWDEPSTDVLEAEKAELYKIGSTALTNIPLLVHVAQKKKPVILSIGGASIGEVEEGIAALRRYTQQIGVLHCNLNYPTDPKDAHLSVLKTLQLAFPEVVPGYSDHTMHPYAAPVAAVALGAKIIEKHITLDKKMKGPDHFFALEPYELETMVKKIRAAEERIAGGLQVEIDPALLGSSEIAPRSNEMYIREFAYTTIISIKDIRKGQPMTADNIRVLRPGKLPRGLEPKFFPLLVEKGYLASRDVPAGKPIAWNDILQEG